MFNVITPHLNSNYTVVISGVSVWRQSTPPFNIIYLDSPDSIKGYVPIHYFFKMKLLVSIPTPLTQVHDYFLNYKFNPYRAPKICFEAYFLRESYHIILKITSSRLFKLIPEIINICIKHPNIHEINTIYTFYPI